MVDYSLYTNLLKHWKMAKSNHALANSFVKLWSWTLRCKLRAENAARFVIVYSGTCTAGNSTWNYGFSIIIINFAIFVNFSSNYPSLRLSSRVESEQHHKKVRAPTLQLHWPIKINVKFWYWNKFFQPIFLDLKHYMSDSLLKWAFFRYLTLWQIKIFIINISFQK